MQLQHPLCQLASKICKISLRGITTSHKSSANLLKGQVLTKETIGTFGYEVEDDDVCEQVSELLVEGGEALIDQEIYVLDDYLPQYPYTQVGELPITKKSNSLTFKFLTLLY